MFLNTMYAVLLKVLTFLQPDISAWRAWFSDIETLILFQYKDY